MRRGRARVVFAIAALASIVALLVTGCISDESKRGCVDLCAATAAGTPGAVLDTTEAVGWPFESRAAFCRCTLAFRAPAADAETRREGKTP